MHDKKILLVLEQCQLQDELLLYFAQSGYKTFSTLNIKRGNFLRENTYDCLIMQMMLSKTDAIELILELKDLKIDTPVVVLDLEGIGSKSAIYAAGASAYFKKPVRAIEVYFVVQKLIKKSGYL